jgi:hypothetical protein
MNKEWEKVKAELRQAAADYKANVSGAYERCRYWLDLLPAPPSRLHDCIAKSCTQ